MRLCQVVSTHLHLCQFLSTNVHYCQLLVMFPLVSTGVHLYPLVSSCVKLWTFWISVTEWACEWSSFSRYSLFFLFHIFHFFHFFSLSPSRASSRSLRGCWWFLNGGILHNGCPTDTSRKLHINFHIFTFPGSAPSSMCLQSIIMECKMTLVVPDRNLGGLWHNECP